MGGMRRRREITVVRGQTIARPRRRQCQGPSEHRIGRDVVGIGEIAAGTDV